MTRLSTRQFSYNRLKKCFSAFVSDFGPSFHLSRVYPDRRDEGLILISDRTGRAVTFILTETKRDRGGDVEFWKLTPTAESLLKQPAASGVSIVLFND